MEPLLDAVTELVALLPPSKIDAIASRLRDGLPPGREQDLQKVVGTPAARAALASLIGTWQAAKLSGELVAGMLMGAAHARERTQRDCAVELVWTGPMTPFVAPRRTEQVLIDVIQQATKELFIVSFVAYDVPSVIAAINAAALRGVEVRILVEASLTQGGSLLVDPVATMRGAVPSAKLYAWTDRPHPFTNGRVHAKVAVADDAMAYRAGDGHVVAVEDRCPHRWAPLSLGRVEGDLLRCMYHGLCFDREGQCVSAPAMQTPPDARVRTYPVAVRDSWIAGTAKGKLQAAS